eukprot:TRINITY_DN17134_c0_g1_i1.p1 TRINITY_DN17134_c0_g1~~TRINITY_DN17134_c0_g1_i1.p1  ORF type:complete len:314 (-),score=65.87 TRINITY_DN17134_c0_g1_i1:287-1228(-)
MDNYVHGHQQKCRATRTERLRSHLQEIGLLPTPQTAPPIVVLDMFGVMTETPKELKAEAPLVLAGPGFNPSSYRDGTDIAFPVTPVVRRGMGPGLRQGGFDAEPACVSQGESAWRHLMVFRGTNTSKLRRRLLTLHNGDDIFIHLKPFKEAVNAETDPSKSSLVTDYIELMTRTRFALIPRGDNEYTTRLFEAICFGAVPVVMADNWVLPFSEPGGADYSAFSLRVRERDWATLPDRLKNFSSGAVCDMQQRALRACHAHFGSIEAQVQTLLSILARRSGAVLSAAKRAAPTAAAEEGRAKQAKQSDPSREEL